MPIIAILCLWLNLTVLTHLLWAYIVGYIAVHWLPYLFLPAPEGYVSELFVSESVRGQGIGTQLLETVTIEAKRRVVIA